MRVWYTGKTEKDLSKRTGGALSLIVPAQQWQEDEDLRVTQAHNHAPDTNESEVN